MIYLTTGANGAGKTLLTLRDVRAKSLAENRPVVYNGRFNLTADFQWKKIDIKDWQAEPDGCIFLVDECHNDFPVRANGAVVPEYVRMLAEHRARGFDFFLITQHPMNIDAFIRRIIGPPGWHRHINRETGAALVSVATYSAVKTDCERKGSNASASVALVAYPKEVYQWYESATLHTVKRRIPFQMKLLAACLFIVPLVGYFGYKTLMKPFQPKDEKALSSTAKVPTLGIGPVAAAPVASSKPVAMSAGEYAQSFAPRVAGLAYTAPRYDAQTAAVNVPYPAACMSMGPRCSCYTQQATVLAVPDDLCRQIVKGGFFVDWQAAVASSNAGRPVAADRAGVQVASAAPSIPSPARPSDKQMP